jgi:hypothetical protein
MTRPKVARTELLAAARAECEARDWPLRKSAPVIESASDTKGLIRWERDWERTCSRLLGGAR